jgi:agmatine deiminase
MIPDSQTNYLYLADSLPKKYSHFYKRFETLLSDCQIDFPLLSGTKDIWAVDYMPIQIAENNFTQFVYSPSYLETPEELESISDAENICKSMGLYVKKSNILLDGGNVIRTTDRVIMSTRVFKENPGIPKKQLIKQLQDTLEVDRLIFIPSDPKDFTGHADGMVRFLDDNTVLINDYSREKSAFQRNFRIALHNAGLKCIEIPYNPYSNKNNNQANGIYINYLQMEGVIIVPVFNIKEDEATVKLFENNFSNLAIKTIECNQIANQGGILNCISWNIKLTNKNSPFRGLGGT